jgi:hypothetical protein
MSRFPVQFIFGQSPNLGTLLLIPTKGVFGLRNLGNAKAEA